MVSSVLVPTEEPEAHEEDTKRTERTETKEDRDRSAHEEYRDRSHVPRRGRFSYAPRSIANDWTGILGAPTVETPLAMAMLVVNVVSLL